MKNGNCSTAKNRGKTEIVRPRKVEEKRKLFDRNIDQKCARRSGNPVRSTETFSKQFPIDIDQPYFQVYMKLLESVRLEIRGDLK